jgi:uncharacterized membrane protein (UPF0127 family)
MFKQVILPILGTAAFIAIVGYFTQNPSGLSFKNFFKITPTSSVQKSVTINGKNIQVDIADTNDKRTKGLSGVVSLPSDQGMLFIFDTKGVSPLFWMKDMLIPLDIIWIGNGKIVHIDKNVPIPAKGTPDANLETYSAGIPIDYVLEVNAGFADSNSIKVGDSVDLSKI